MLTVRPAPARHPSRPQTRLAAEAAAVSHAGRVAKALEHIATLSGDPDVLYKHAANYALKLSSRGGEGMRTYVADLEEPEEDEMADEAEAEGEEGEAAEPEAEEEEDAGIPELGEPKYDDMFFRYVSVAAEKGDDQDWLVGKKLERGTGVSFALVDAAPKAPWIDAPNVMTYRGPPREPREGEEPAEPDAPPEPTRVHFVGGFPRAGAYFAVPIVLATGEVAGMLCADTVKTPHGGNGRAIAEADKDLMRAVAKAAGVAMDVAAAARRERLLAAAEEQAKISETLAAVEAPEEGEESKEGEDEAAEPEPEEEAPPEPEEGAEPTDEQFVAATEFKMRSAQKRLAAAEKNLARKQKRFDAVKPLIDVVDDDALAELRSLPRAPKATWRVVKAGLYITGHKKFEFETWALTRKQIVDTYNDSLKALDPTKVEARDPKAWEGVHRCLNGLKDRAVMKESKVGALLFRWIEGFAGVSDAALEVSELKATIEDCENEIEKAQERIAEAAADAEAAAAQEAAAAAAGGGEGDAPAEEPPAE